VLNPEKSIEITNVSRTQCLFHIFLVKRKEKKKLRVFSDEKEYIQSINKYIPRNALANEIITIKRFATFYVVTSFPPRNRNNERAGNTFSCVVSAVTINTQFPRIVRKNLTSFQGTN